MNKTAIKNFAIWARNKLIADISYRAGLMGITADGIHKALPQSTGQTEFYDIGTAEPYAISGEAIRQRDHLVELIRTKEKDTDYKTAYKYIIEEVAYTWFNRLIAVRFMEVNDYLPSHIRVLSSEYGKIEPDLVTTPFDADLDFTGKEQQIIIELKNDNKLDEVFRLLFIKQCNALNEILPALFEKTDDYTELLLNLSVIDQDGVIYHLIHDIPEEDFDVERGGQVEIIGWLYQYYISEKHEEIVDTLHGKVVKKEEVPAATQLFTTDWVVCYLIDNSVGRYWIERNSDSTLENKLAYFVRPKDGMVKKVNEIITPQDVTVFDPCVGSGHFLIYAFDVLMMIYAECGYSERDAAVEIVKNNLFGLDIDGRASQLAYFSVMMKARRYDRRFFSRDIQPHIFEITESNAVDRMSIEYFCGEDATLKQDIEALLDTLMDAKEYGSVLQMPSVDFERIKMRLSQLGGEISMYNSYLFGDFQSLIYPAEIMSGKYAIVATNPPYLNKYDSKLKMFIGKNYADYKGDLFSVFMIRNFDYCKEGGYSGFMTPMVWMFIQTYEKLRRTILDTKGILTLIQMEYSAYEEATVPICTFVLRNYQTDENGYYFKLSDFVGGMEIQRQKVIEAQQNKECGYYFEVDSKKFDQIQGSPISYWVSDNVYKAYSNPNLDKIAQPRHGLATSDNARFLRLWFEVDINKTSLITKCDYSKKWFPMNKGGAFRKWYGNLEWIINYENDGKELKDYAISIYKCSTRTIQNTQFYFKESLTWSALTSGAFSVRWSDVGSLFGSGGYSAFVAPELIKYVLALMNNKVNAVFIKIVSPTLNYEVGHIKTIPVCVSEKQHAAVNILVDNCIEQSKLDWDSFETSWDFQVHPLTPMAYKRQEKINAQITSEENKRAIILLSECYRRWEQVCEKRFLALKKNEEQLNHIFIDVYGLQDELEPEVEDRDVTVRKADLHRDICSLLSYAVGCMFGRYSIDCKGIIYAGGRWDETKYSSFIPDIDNVIPITDEEYLEDDIVSRLCEWLKIVYGEASLEDNLNYIANALGNKGSSSRETIRHYFLNDFFKDHQKVYQKRPIYWLFDSGKQNGFKALAYLHRYNADTIGNLRVDYLHRMQRIYESEIGRMQDMIEHSTNTREVGQATKRRDKLTKQLKECREYDEKLAHLALSRIELDLDDGVKVNYRKVQTANDGKFYEVLADSKNIMAKK